MKHSDKLYIGFRKHVKIEDLKAYDSEYFSKKRHSHPSMISLINRFVDVENQVHKLTDPKEISLFAYFLNDYMEKHKPLNKYLAKVSETPITADVHFLFKDPM